MNHHTDQTISKTFGSQQPSRWLIDLLERVAVTALYGWLVVRVITHFDTEVGLVGLLPLLSEGLVVVFILVRRGTNCVSMRVGDWALAFAATCAPLLVVPHADGAWFSPWLCFVVWMVGMFVQLHAKIVLGRSFGLVPAHRGLKISGPYRLVRHPMYAGYLLTHIAFFVLSPSLWNFAVYAMCYSVQVPRLLAEERLLSRDASYLQYVTSVKYRLLPGLF